MVTPDLTLGRREYRFSSCLVLLSPSRDPAGQWLPRKQSYYEWPFPIDIIDMNNNFRLRQAHQHN